MCAVSCINKSFQNPLPLIFLCCNKKSFHLRSCKTWPPCRTTCFWMQYWRQQNRVSVTVTSIVTSKCNRKSWGFVFVNKSGRDKLRFTTLDSFVNCTLKDTWPRCLRKQPSRLHLWFLNPRQHDKKSAFVWKIFSFECKRVSLSPDNHSFNT